MRCRTCDYRLWNLFTRRCPECGTPFKPSDYEFTTNSVQFRCPHCGQSYYGTGERGHLVPAEFDCIGCGRHIHMDEMVLFPTEGVEEKQTKIETVPWIERAERGRVRAWLSTVGMALIRPGRLMDMLPEENATGQAIIFGVVTTLLVIIVGLAPFFAFPLLFMSFGLGGVGGWTGLLSILFMMGSLLMMIALAIAIMFLWGLIIHGLLRITGVTAGGLDRTYQAVFYGTGANVGTAVPCMGPYVGWIWCMISTAIMLKCRQRVSGLRATFAVVALPLSLIGLIIGFYVWFFVSVLSTVGATTPAPGFPFPTTQPAAQAASPVPNAILMYAGDHDGAGPDHAAELVARGYLQASDLMTPESQTKADQIVIGETTLAGLQSLRREPARKQAEAAAAKLPPNTVAHRLGDWVFTYHGITLNPPPDGRIWLVVQCLDPDANAGASSSEVIAFCADGRMVVLPDSALAAGLRDQNSLRQSLGLPGLPDPRQVTHGRPAATGEASKQ
ncbi:MAG: hypothetical protein QUV05_10780 [Phycisphaerae bacterium]|nr:hypothetical protein [Phycisphaerae bacterium]